MLNNTLSTLLYCFIPITIVLLDFSLFHLCRISATLVGVLNKTKNKYINAADKISSILIPISICVFLVLFSALKSSSQSFHVGYDTWNYRSFFESMSNYTFKEVLTTSFHYDRGYAIYCFILRNLKLPYTFFAIISYSLVYGFTIAFFYSFSRKPSLSVALFICFGLFTLFMSSLRQAMAISICLFSILFLFKKNVFVKLISIPFVIVASLLHKSSAMFFIIMPLFFVNFRNRKAFICYLIGIVSLVFLILPVSHYIFLIYTNPKQVYSFYPTAFGNFSFSGSVLLCLICIIICFVINCFKLPIPLSFSFKFLDKFDGLYLTKNMICEKSDTIAIVLMTFQLVTGLCENFIFLLSRSGAAGMAGICLFLPYFVNRVFNKKMELLANVAALVFGIAYFYITTLRPNYLGLLPYGII